MTMVGAVGFLDYFRTGEAAQLKRHAKRMCNLNAQKEDRTASAYWLAENASEEAIIGLLNRFNMTYEHRMKDSEEKQLVYDLLLGIGTAVTQPVRQWVRKNPSFALPLRLVDHFEGADAAVEVLLDMLGREVDPFKPEKKRQILIRLAEYRDERIIERVPACLEDFDGEIRYAAAEALIAQETDAVRDELARALANRNEESNRLRDRIAVAFEQRSWSLGAFAEDIADNPPYGWAVSDSKLQRAPT
ncbi:MAG: HEAT repeat protein [Myxococcota bacterium]|jgi:HEAT repeat protein